MSLFNTLRTSVSGLNAQSNKLSTIGDNIANSSTTGYKAASAQFETLLGNEATGSYESGGVQTDIRYGVSAQGTLDTTTSATDLAIKGNGFFVVSNGGAGSFLTRAGSFVPDSNGDLVNAAGYQLEGRKILPDGTVDQSLSIVNVTAGTLQCAASTTATLALNLPSTATAVATGAITPGAAVASDPTATPPVTGSSAVSYTDKTSVTTYDSLGTANVIDLYFTKTADNTWEVSAYKQSDAAASGGFPYSSAALGTGKITFDSTTGAVASNTLSSVTIGGNNVALNLAGTTQLAANFNVTTATANGNAPSTLSSVKIGTDGTLTAVYASGVQIALYDIPVATVISPDTLTALNGNVYQTNAQSGDIVLQDSGKNGAGTIESGELEESTVDLATELTDMITAQRAYEANSKVLQAASDLLSTLNRLQTS